MTDCRPWLPEAAIDVGLDRGIADAARDWSAHWLGAGALRPLARDLLAADAPNAWLAIGETIAMGLAPMASDVLGRALLAAPAGAALAGAADRRIADRIVDAALRDLGTRIAAAAGHRDARLSAIDRPPLVGDAYRRSLGLDHAPLIVCLVAREAAVAIARPAGVAQPRAKLTPLDRALAPQRVTLAGRIGGCTMSLAELASLEPGDVVLLDSTLGSPVALTLDGSARALARCTVETGDQHLALTLLDAIDR